MDGVTILNKTVVTDIPSWALNILLIGIAATLIGSVLACKVNNAVLEVIFAIVAIIGCICFLYVGIVQPEVETGRYRYEVIMDESVQFTDIYEKYEVIEQRGEIWVLEDKEN